MQLIIDWAMVRALMFFVGIAIMWRYFPRVLNFIFLLMLCACHGEKIKQFTADHVVIALVIWALLCWSPITSFVIDVNQLIKNKTK